ncbi:MAG: hypothetical protein JST35_07385 [Armatimonadetes bacterium]|nr:hypothetical protein [Armatimonadota bacterium]
MYFSGPRYEMLATKRECSELAKEISVYAVEPEKLPEEVKKQVELTPRDALNAGLIRAFLLVLEGSIGPSYSGTSFAEQLDRLDELVERVPHIPIIASGEWNLVRLRKMLESKQLQEWERMMRGPKTFRRWLWTNPNLGFVIIWGSVLLGLGTFERLMGHISFNQFMARLETVAMMFLLLWMSPIISQWWKKTFPRKDRGPGQVGLEESI